MGVAYPIIVRFSTTVTRRADAERHMVVVISGRRVAGAWSWTDAKTVMFRPRSMFWRAHVTIRIAMSLRAVMLKTSRTHRWLGNRASTRTVIFRTGRSMISYVDAKRHRMRVVIDGKLARVMKTSLGKPGYLTRSGIKVVTEKYRVRHMSSVLAGITDPRDQYDLQAPYAVRITPSGEFVHGAPWAVARIGRRNGSHGCTNLLVRDARWFYVNARLGDPVVTKGTRRKMEPTNGLGGPWNLTWTQWLAHSALKGR